MLVRRLARPMLASTFIAGGIDTLRNPSAKVPAAEAVTDRIESAAQSLAQSAAQSANGAVADATRTVEDKAAETADRIEDAAPGDTAVKTKEKVEQATTTAREQVAAVARGERLPALETETYVKANAAAMVGAGVLLASGKLPRLSSVVLAATIVPTTLAGHRFWEEDDPQQRAQQQIHFFKNVSLLGGLVLSAVDLEGRPGVAYRSRQAARDAKKAARHARREAELAARAAKAQAQQRLAALPGPLG